MKKLNILLSTTIGVLLFSFLFSSPSFSGSGSFVQDRKDNLVRVYYRHPVFAIHQIIIEGFSFYSPSVPTVEEINEGTVECAKAVEGDKNYTEPYLFLGYYLKGAQLARLCLPRIVMSATFGMRICRQMKLTYHSYDDFILTCQKKEAADL